MPINVDIKIENGILKSKATGQEKDLQEAQDYGKAVLTAALENNSTKIICDETKLIYTIGTFDSYALAKTASQSVPHQMKVAVVCNPNQFKDAKFWETVAINRGVQVRVFKDLISAEKWIE